MYSEQLQIVLKCL